ncbi:N-acetylmuramoyl-L-alanine amidase [uncultured Prevotella sp.]|uniref:N-acetylmuramoyl-L-alanine amidase n=1 Tax=uncultured Prevotella sp. TaxID=159272 RepID=UPI0025908DEA|nr:N-acetylmuramoyl-L-alanine amidase [uncultured Prevotella sp.]
MSREIHEIIVHCTATPEGREMTVKQIDDIHRTQNKWCCIGYHKVIYLDGTIHDGRPIDMVGAHCSEDGHNRHSIGIVYVGGCAKDGKTPKDTRTPEQKVALANILEELHKTGLQSEEERSPSSLQPLQRLPCPLHLCQEIMSVV